MSSDWLANVAALLWAVLCLGTITLASMSSPKMESMETTWLLGRILSRTQSDQTHVTTFVAGKEHAHLLWPNCSDMV